MPIPSFGADLCPRDNAGEETKRPVCIHGGNTAAAVAAGASAAVAIAAGCVAGADGGFGACFAT